MTSTAKSKEQTSHSCYRHTKLEFDPSETAYDSFVDATYILAMKNSKRREQYMKQISTYPLTRIVYIQENDGFRNCKKRVCDAKKERCEHVETPPHDIVHAYYNAFRHALEHNYTNIIILEDDVVFSPDVMNPHVVGDIKEFVEKYSQPICLGVFPMVSYKYTPTVRKGLLCSGTHAVVYPLSVMRKRFLTSVHHIKDVDVWMSRTSFKNYYQRPLAYQVFEETENQGFWGNHNPFLSIGSYFIIWYVKLFNLHKTYEPGTSRAYYYNRIAFDFVVPAFLLFALFFIVWYVNKERV